MLQETDGAIVNIKNILILHKITCIKSFDSYVLNKIDYIHLFLYLSLCYSLSSNQNVTSVAKKKIHVDYLITLL